MFASELITKLADLVNQHGDLVVIDEDSNEIFPPCYTYDKTDKNGRCFVFPFDDETVWNNPQVVPTVDQW